MQTIFLHGLGQGPDSWEQTVDALGVDALCPDLFAPFSKGKPTTYATIYDAFAAYCETLTPPFHLCGLSLGAIVAMHYALDHPDRTASLVLIAGQYRTAKSLVIMQNILFRLLSASSLRGMGLKKKELIKLTNSVSKLNFSRRLGEITCPTLLLCGEKDQANRKASEQMVLKIPNASLQWIPGAGHVVNYEAPAALAASMKAFYGSFVRE